MHELVSGKVPERRALPPLRCAWMMKLADPDVPLRVRELLIRDALQ